ncbi:hypothetical protein BRADI_5g01445v3 [Brachypodium distachyon]|uniref:TF-B3 domain-containing protein n=1 Tax=Brachypodium distachyon TaxID=15368 RepID=A0A2K2CET4_BRADI|nr:hypothetical protein BRADI_5g01445v3 [Brachypodium distachyon]
MLNFQSNGGMLAGAGCSQSAKTEMGQKMALVHQRFALLDSSSKSDGDDVFEPMDERAIVVRQQSIAAIYDDEVIDYVPLRIVRPDRVESEEEKPPSAHHKHDTQNTSTALRTYKRKRGKLAGSNSTKSKMAQKPALVDSNSSSRSRSESDNDDDSAPMVPDVDGRNKYASVQDICSSAWERALEVKEKLPVEDPSFAKRMLHSHVVQGFWLGLPSGFCREHLPKHDVIIELEDEDGHSYDAKYLGYKQGLSGGWRNFALRHDIKIGDAVVFQLMRSTRFKVYILRENKFTITDGALGLLSLDTSNENNISKEESSDEDAKSMEDPEVTRVSSKVDDDDDSNNNIPNGEAVDDDIRSPDSDTDFEGVTSFSNFNIVVDGSVINRELFPDHQRRTYYELCQAQKSFLHKNLLKKINPTLALGVIIETVNIAEGIRASRASSHEDFSLWKKILESFEILGMDVTFMRKRVDDLLGLLPSRSLGDCLVADGEHEGYEEVKLEHKCARKKMRALELKMSSLKNALKEMDAAMEEMESSVKKNAQAMRQIATAPW